MALTYADGDQEDPVVLAQYKEIVDTLRYEVETGETLNMMQTVKTPSARRRILLTCSVAVFSMLSGNNIISYYLGTMLDNAGITDSTTQLEIVSDPACFESKADWSRMLSSMLGASLSLSSGPP